VLYLKEAVEKKPLSQELKNAPGELLRIIDELGTDKKCHGSVIDGDLAIILKDYFTRERNQSRSVCCILTLNKVPI
jgi:hypothetical protein